MRGRGEIRGAHTPGETRNTHPEFTSLMYVLGGDRSLSHELLIALRHNSPRASHPLFVALSSPNPLPVSLPYRRYARQLTHLRSLCTSALEICAAARLPAVMNDMYSERCINSVYTKRRQKFFR